MPEYREEDLVDLGAATTETRGSAPVGIYDSETQQHFLGGGLDTED